MRVYVDNILLQDLSGSDKMNTRGVHKMNISKDTQIVLDAINSINPDVQDRFYSVDSIHSAVKSEHISRYEDTFAIL